MASQGQDALLSDHSPRLLIVEDEPDQAELLSELLDEEGFTSDIASNGADALNLVSHYLYDLCTVDWKLPDVQGHLLINKIKLQQPTTRCILLTGLPQLGSAELAVNYGADGYAVKPVDPPFLLSLIESILLQRRLSQENERLEGALQTLRAFRYEICRPLEGLMQNLDALTRRSPYDPGLTRTIAQLRLAGDSLLKTLDRLDSLDRYQTRESPAGPILDIEARARAI
ncbi:MAG: response regulator [Armatimonadetes bacterium]|nr:response regulator [Armatimonadota bacterium]